MNRAAATGYALLLAASLATAADAPPTVGSVTQNNGRSSDGWFAIKTPSILRVTPSDRVAADSRIALAEYDRLVDLAADPQVRAEALRRAAYLRVRRVDAGEADAGELRRAIELYQRLLAEMPGDPANDLAYYQLARAYQLAGEDAQAVASLQQLGQRFPRSELYADAVFRAAESLYLHGRYAEAETEYARIVALGEKQDHYRPAQYKYGWSLYKQAKYEQAVPVFLAVLDRELPPGVREDPLTALAATEGAGGLAAEVLRVVGLSFAALGGGPAVSHYFEQSASEPRFSVLLYAALGAQMLERQRYSDAAASYTAFVQRYPRHHATPGFQARVVAAYRDGGFAERVAGAQQQYVDAYGPGAAYWQQLGQQPSAEVMAELRRDLDELGRYHHAAAQATPQTQLAQRHARFLQAADSYQRMLTLFPQDAEAIELRLRYADALLDGGQMAAAAEQYATSAYESGPHPRAAEAAYATVQTWQQLAALPAQRAMALPQAVAAALKLSDQFPAHPQRAQVLLAAADALYELQDHGRAIVVAVRALDALPAAAYAQRAAALDVIANAHYVEARYTEAEAAYAQLLVLPAVVGVARTTLVERMAASIYRQAEAARDAGDLRTAAVHFQRVGVAVPTASIRASADYDAAAAYYELKDWSQAQRALEAFRAQHPDHALLAEADRKLALSYQNEDKLSAAAATYARIARRDSETAALREDAAWRSAQLFDRARNSAAAGAYTYYLDSYPQALAQGQQARRRLADLSPATASLQSPRMHWLREIVRADQAAGGGNEASRQMAAQASVEIGRVESLVARNQPLTAPVERSLKQRLAATQVAVATLDRAAAYGYAETTTAATYELGVLFRDLGRALLDSERPRNLAGLEREQYDLLLEEQAYPFEEKAIAAHEANLDRLRQGLWNDWIQRSAGALAELEPAKYSKRDHRETSYDALF